jgi:hypothetical protein
MLLTFDFEKEKLKKLEFTPQTPLYGYSISVAIPNGKIIIVGGINKQLNTIVG